MSNIQEKIQKTLKKFHKECGNYKQAVARTAVRHNVAESDVVKASNQ